MMMRTFISNRAAFVAALILPLAACAGADMSETDRKVHGYQYDADGNRVAAFVFHGFDERDCAQYSLRPLREDAAVVSAMFVWDGEQFVLDQSACKPGATPR